MRRGGSNVSRKIRSNPDRVFGLFSRCSRDTRPSETALAPNQFPIHPQTLKHVIVGLRRLRPEWPPPEEQTTGNLTLVPRHSLYTALEASAALTDSRHAVHPHTYLRCWRYHPPCRVPRVRINWSRCRVNHRAARVPGSACATSPPIVMTGSEAQGSWHPARA